MADPDAVPDLHRRKRLRTVSRALLAALGCAVLAPGVFVPSASAAAPSASTVDVVSLSQDSARLRGSVNPGGEATEYWFEYGKTGSYGSFAPLAKDGSAGSGSDELVVSEAIRGLEPGTDYHFRIVASNASGTEEGADEIFTTHQPAADCPNAAIRQQEGSEFLADCRTYELVSPADKLGQRLGGNTDDTVDLTLDRSGERVLYMGLYATPPAQAPSGSASQASRTREGWLTLGLFPAPGPNSLGLGMPFQDMVLRASTPDQRTIAYWDNTTAPYGSLNVRRADGTIVRVFDVSNLQLSGAYAFGGGPGQAWAFMFSDDGQRLYFASNERLGPAVGLPGAEDILYEWVDDGFAGELRVVNRTDSPAVTLLSSSAASLGGSAAEEGSRVVGARGLRNAVSDGSDGHQRVFFQTPAPTADQTPEGGPIYMREDASRTVQVSAPEGANSPATQLRYLDASEDGSKVFFWAGSKLTDDATAGPGIYRYDVDPSGPGDLVFIGSAGADAGTGEPPTALASPDGENLLFSDRLTATTKVSVAGTVSPVVATQVGSGAFSGSSVTFSPSIRDDRCPSASVTPDGRYFVFSAGSSIASSIYRLDTRTGDLKVLSNPPVPPVGPQPTNAPTALFVSACAPSGGAPRYFKSRLVSDDGRRVFFTSRNALTSDDSSAQSDVYEWFDDGSSTGRLSVLTKSGGSFLGVDGSGETAFVNSSNDPLIWADGDRESDIYAVKVGGGFARERRSSCNGDLCQGGPASRPGHARPGSGADGAGDERSSAGGPVFSLAMSAAQRARLAAGRRAVLRVRVGRAGLVRVIGRAKVGKSNRTVVRASRRASRAGTLEVGLRLSPVARRLVMRKGLRVSLSVRLGGGPPKRLGLAVRRPK